MAENSEQPIIIKRIKKGGASHHGGAWKVAFADFMTAMMAFFLVMWLVGQSPEVKQGVAGFFRNPGKYQQQGKSGVLKGSGAIMDTKSESSPSPIKNKKGGMADKEGEQKEMKLAARNILDELKKQEEFQRLKNNVKMQLTSEGLRIILNESDDVPAFFEPGSAKLLQKSAIILITIAKELGRLDNHLVIEGHTDASYAGGKDYTNWELSADRANSARALLEVSGLYEGQVREVRGYADKFPMIVADPSDERNRRVTLIVLYESRERQYDEIEVGSDLMAEIG